MAFVCRPNALFDGLACLACLAGTGMTPLENTFYMVEPDGDQWVAYLHNSHEQDGKPVRSVTKISEHDSHNAAINSVRSKGFAVYIKSKQHRIRKLK